MRRLLVLFLLACVTGLPSASATTAAPPTKVLTHAADTLPELTRAETRELRQLEREQRRALRRDDMVRDARGVGNNPFAIASLASGIGALLAFFLGVFLIGNGLTPLIALLGFAAATVFGAIGIRRAKRRGLRQRGLAIAGFVIGLVGLGAYLFGLIVALALLASGGF